MLYIYMCVCACFHPTTASGIFVPMDHASMTWLLHLHPRAGAKMSTMSWGGQDTHHMPNTATSCLGLHGFDSQLLAIDRPTVGQEFQSLLNHAALRTSGLVQNQFHSLKSRSTIVPKSGSKSRWIQGWFCRAMAAQCI